MTAAAGAGTRHRRSGCGIAAALALIAIVLTVYFVGRPVREAKHTEQLVNDRFGYAPTFVPRADGSVPAERLEAFLRIRERVLQHCAGFQATLEDAGHLDRLEKDRTRPKLVVFHDAVSTLKRMFGFAPQFLRFVEDRSGALLEEEMGLGEYMYIYVLAYREQLGDPSESPYADIDEARVSERARSDLTQILGNQLARLESDGASGDLEPLIAALREQISALTEGRQTIPWQDGHPPAIAASLAPFADRLAASYCEGVAGIELLQKNKGLDFRG